MTYYYYELTDARHSNQLIKGFIRFHEKYTDLLMVTH